MKSIEELKALKQEVLSKNSSDTRIVVGMSTCGIAAGAKSVFETLKNEAESKNLANVSVIPSGCLGMCRLEPMVEVYKNGERATYVSVDSDVAKKIINDHVIGGRLVEENLITD